MTDPAIEAAFRVSELVAANLIDREAPWPMMTAAAREALRPVREKSEQLLNPNNAQMSRLWWDGVRYALEQIAPLIFTTEELER